MSKSRKNILDTEHMLNTLTAVLWRVSTGLSHSVPLSGPVRDEAEQLRRISMTLHRWHELECGDSNDHGAWTIVRGHKRVLRDFEYDDDGKPYLERHSYRWMRDGTTGKQVNHTTTSYTAIPDREAGACKRLAAILKRYPGLQAYIQTDPRGCALYILKPGDVAEGQDMSSCYTNGLAVYR